MHLISFENDLDPLRLAFLHNREFIYLRHSAIGGLLGEGQWQSPRYPGLHWTLLQGDFLENIAHSPAPPDIIFFDMFSSWTDADQWTLRAFQKVFAACAGRPVELFTYTCSTSIRATLLVAGFHVARGVAIEDKLDTTIALTPEAAKSASPGARDLLSPEWLSRWSRSSSQFPIDLPPDQQASFEQAIRAHPQFSIH
jgi:queuine tRNA-ribosyltransferase